MAAEPAEQGAVVGPVRRAFGFVFAVFGGLVVIFWAFLVSFPILPWVVLPRGRREKYAVRGAQLFAWLILRPLLWLRIERVGLENLPKNQGFLVLSNHRSWIDVPILMLYTRSNGVSKAEVKYVPFFGVNGYLSGAIFFDRKSKMGRGRVVTDALKLMKGGANVHVFPEGTRTRDGKLHQRVFLKLAEAAWENGVDVVPACVWGTENVVPAVGLSGMPFQSVGIEVAAPLDRAAFSDAQSFARASWEKVAEIAARRGADHPFSSAA